MSHLAWKKNEPRITGALVCGDVTFDSRPVDIFTGTRLVYKAQNTPIRNEFLAQTYTAAMNDTSVAKDQLRVPLTSDEDHLSLPNAAERLRRARKLILRQKALLIEREEELRKLKEEMARMLSANSK